MCVMTNWKMVEIQKQNRIDEASLLKLFFIILLCENVELNEKKIRTE
jgi:hypothetical protein